jgi:hypothetical protein
MSAIDISKLTDTLGAHCQEHRDELVTEILLDESLDAKFEVMDEITDELPLPNLEVGDLIKPADPVNFTPTSNALKFGAEVLKVRGIKADLLLIPQVLEKTWLGKLKSAKNPLELPFEAFIMTYIGQKVKENLHLQGLFKGEYDAAGTTPIDTLDGFLKLVADAITASKITPIVTGVITKTNVIDKLELVYDGLGDAYKAIPTQMKVAPTIYDWYNRAYRTTFGGNNNYNGMPGKVFLDGTNCELVREPGMSGSQRVMASVKENFVYGCDTSSGFNLDIQKFNRSIKLLIDFKAGVQFKQYSSKALAVNDQA